MKKIEKNEEERVMKQLSNLKILLDEEIIRNGQELEKNKELAKFHLKKLKFLFRNTGIVLATIVYILFFTISNFNPLVYLFVAPFFSYLSYQVVNLSIFSITEEKVKEKIKKEKSQLEDLKELQDRIEKILSKPVTNQINYSKDINLLKEAYEILKEVLVSLNNLGNPNIKRVDSIFLIDGMSDKPDEKELVIADDDMKDKILGYVSEESLGEQNPGRVKSY